MAGSDYLARQAATLLRLAKITKDAKVSAKFAAKAADLNARAEDVARGASPKPADRS
jgi:hypothetical protein